MALPKPPNPLTAFAKTVFGNGATPLWPWLNLYQYYHDMTASGGTTWRRFSFRIVDTVTAETADDAYFNIDLVNYTNGVIDDSWNDTDYSTAIGNLSEIAVAWLPYMDSRKQVSEIRSYKMAFNPDYVVGQPGSNPFLHAGAPERITAQAHQGTGVATPCPPQSSLSVTHQVPARRHWGRFYLPFPAVNLMTSDGQASATAVDAVAAATSQAYNVLSSSQLYPVIVQTQDGKVASPALHQVVNIQVDSNVDVIRRRRAFTTRYRKVAGAAI